MKASSHPEGSGLLSWMMMICGFPQNWKNNWRWHSHQKHRSRLLPAKWWLVPRVETLCGQGSCPPSHFQSISSLAIPGVKARTCCRLRPFSQEGGYFYKLASRTVSKSIRIGIGCFGSSELRELRSNSSTSPYPSGAWNHFETV